MWGSSIVGFGTYHYTYKSGREGDWMLAGFSPRKGTMTLYLFGFDLSSMEDELRILGKHKTGKGCLYIKRLADIDRSVLRNLIKTSVDRVKSKDFLL